MAATYYDYYLIIDMVPMPSTEDSSSNNIWVLKVYTFADKMQ